MSPQGWRNDAVTVSQTPRFPTESRSGAAGEAAVSLRSRRQPPPASPALNGEPPRTLAIRTCQVGHICSAPTFEILRIE
jgi:hypothetical protein